MEKLRAIDADSYSLPKGLPSGAEVTVVSYDLKTYNHVVRDAAGREWTIKRRKISAESSACVGRTAKASCEPLAFRVRKKLSLYAA